MNQNFRKTLIAGAIAALISSPAWAATDSPGNSPDQGAATSATEQPRDSSSQMKSDREGTRDSSRAAGPETGQSTKDPSSMGRSPSAGASRDGGSDSPLYSRTPEDVIGMEVIGANGEDIGEIKKVVLGSDRQNVYAVIAAGGFLGFGEREFLVPLDELQVLGDNKVQLGFTKDAIESRPEYDSAQYRELESNRPISEFSAFEPTSDASSQMGSRPGDDAKSPMGAAQSEAGRSKSDDARMGAKPGDAGSRDRISDNPLYNRTPDDLSGMEVVGSDGDKIGKISNVVTGSDREDVHVVISSGGVLGIGARKVLVPLDELQVAGENKVRVGWTKDAMESRPEYKSGEYSELESNRPISEFSAFEPTKDRADPAAKERAPGERY